MFSPVTCLSIVFYLYFISKGAAGNITCFSCDSSKDDPHSCMSPPHSDYVANCADADVCTKITLWSPTVKNVIIRGCESDGPNICENLANDIRKRIPDLYNFRCSVCDEDYCNGN